MSDYETVVYFWVVAEKDRSSEVSQMESVPFELRKNAICYKTIQVTTRTDRKVGKVKKKTEMRYKDSYKAWRDCRKMFGF